MKAWKIGLSTFVVLVVSTVCFGKSFIVQPSDAVWLEGQAAKELAAYAEKITTKQFSVVNDDEIENFKKGNTYFIIGSVERNLPSRKLLKNVDFSILQRLPQHSDGFVVEGQELDCGARVILFVGRSPLASLYAVYDYLETVCKVGFFQDGEYVPSLPKLPVEKISLVFRPRFDTRLHFAWNAHRAIKKYHSFWWTEEEWQKEFDWMAKQRLNMFRIDMGYYSRFAGDAYEQAYPKIGPEVEEILYPKLAGWPQNWGWPAKYRTELTQKIFRYGRKRGIKFIYAVDYATVPFRFKEHYPEIEYLPGDMYGNSRRISPNDPHGIELLRKNLTKIVELFGTDHMYMCTPYCEVDVAGGDKQKNLELRTKAAKQLVKAIKQVDPEGLWVTDSWDMSNRSEFWGKENVKNYLQSFDRDDFYIYDTTAEMLRPPLYRKFDGWFGKKWAFGILQCLAGDDALHGNPVELIRRVKEVIDDDNCTGLFMIPEMTHHNIMFWDLACQLSRNPAEVTYDNYLKDFTQRRYGKQSADRMYQVWSKVSDAVYWHPPTAEGGDRFSFTLFPQATYYVYNGLPSLTGPEDMLRNDIALCRLQVPLLSDACKMALAEAGEQKNNNLYREDLIAIFRSYAGKLFNVYAGYATIEFKRGNLEAFQDYRKRAMSCMRAIQEVLSVCPSYSLEKTIQEACSVTGHNKYLPLMIRQACINVHYTTNDVYEQYGGYYIPRMELYFDDLERKLKNEKKTETGNPYEKVNENWRKNGGVDSGRLASDDDVVAVIADHFEKLSSEIKFWSVN